MFEIIDITVIVSLITALAAIFSPLLTAIVQRKFDLELKKIELIYSEKFQCYKNYAEKFGALLENPYVDACQDFISASYQAMLLSNHESKVEIAFLLELLKDNNYQVDSAKISEQFEKSLYFLFAELDQIKNKKGK